ncbi:putative NADPH oxidase organizer 1, partial [Triplophysa rosa]
SEPRFPVDVRVIGVMQKEKSKVYMTSVLWSDKSEVTVYRSLRDFKTLHKQLKKKFPVENPLRKKDRVLPRFGARNVKRPFPTKGLSKSVDRLKSLEKYCSSLLQCDSTVSHSTEVIRFFLPNEQELQPEFTQNSVMILQSDFIPSAKVGADMQKRLSFGNVTQPFVSKTYRCVAPYETKDTKNKPFKVAVDKRLDVLIKDQAGWWLVENEDKRLAWFPAPYLELCDEEEDEDEFDSTCDMSLYCSTRSYTSKKEDELCLSIGAVVEVLQMSDNGWWLVRYNTKAGYVPSMYLKPYISPTFSFQTLQRKLHSATINLSTSSFIHKSHSLEVLSKSVPEQREESGSLKSIFRDDGTDFSFSSSDTDSISQSVSSSDGDESLRQPNKDDSGISSGQSSPSISSYPVKAAMVPRVPPRPQTQEILSRCTTFTRKAALATSARLFPRRAGFVDGGKT